MRILASEPNLDVRWLTFSPDGTAIGFSASHSDYYSSREAEAPGPEVWDIISGERRPLGETGLARTGRFCFHPSGQWLLGPSEDEGLVIYNLATQKSREIKVESKHVTNVTMTVDGSAVVYYHYEYNRSNRGYACREWTPEGELPLRWSAPTFLDPKGDSSTFGFVLLADRERILTSERDGGLAATTHLAFRSLATGAALASANIGNYDRPVIATAPDDSTFVVLSKKVVLVFLESRLKAPVHTIRSAGKLHFTGIAFHPSGRFLAVTSNDETVTLYDTATWNVARTFTWAIGKMRSIAFSPDGTLAAAGSDTGKVVVWDVDV